MIQYLIVNLPAFERNIGRVVGDVATGKDGEGVVGVGGHGEQKLLDGLCLRDCLPNDQKLGTVGMCNLQWKDQEIQRRFPKQQLARWRMRN